MATTADIKKDAIMKKNGELFMVTDFQHVNPGKGSAFVRTRIKNLRTGKTYEETYKSGETIELVDVEKRRMDFLYSDPTGLHFMDTETYEQIALSREILEDKAKFLKEGTSILVLMFEGQAISVELPKKINLKVVEAAPAVKGDTAGGNVTKEVMVETGYKLNVPMFIKEGDEVVINTDTGLYVGRA